MQKVYGIKLPKTDYYEYKKTYDDFFVFRRNVKSDVIQFYNYKLDKWTSTIEGTKKEYWDFKGMLIDAFFKPDSSDYRTASRNEVYGIIKLQRNKRVN